MASVTFKLALIHFTAFQCFLSLAVASFTRYKMSG